MTPGRGPAPARGRPYPFRKRGFAMAWLRKSRGLPGGAPGGHVWTTPQDVVEVPDDLAGALLAIPDAGFETVAAPEESAEAPEPTLETPAPAKKAAASKSAAKTPVQE